MSPRGRKLPEPEAPTRPDWLVVVLSAAGLVVAGYLTWLKWLGHGALFCVTGSSCDIVQASRYAIFLGVPTALWGAGLYAALAVLGATGLTRPRWLAAFLVAAAAVGFSVYLTALSVFVLGATCGYCLGSAAIAVALLVALLRRRPPASGTPLLRPVRLATYGGLAAAGAIVLGAFVFAAPGSAPGYALGLARHLKATGAMMYGAYW
ncbi:MAG TPA: vitamin K epoxide reductase family protein [Methylomirabilota bacterium]|jgi:uncharacterized membrane protein|nr:vitamin K epoxide reductase family protein [Methylomirabilota bacterium]